MLHPPPATTQTIAAAAAPRANELYIQLPAGRRGPRHIKIRPASGAVARPAFTRSASPSGAGRMAMSRSVSSPAPCPTGCSPSEEGWLLGEVFIGDSLDAGAGRPSGCEPGKVVNERWIR